MHYRRSLCNGPCTLGGEFTKGLRSFSWRKVCANKSEMNVAIHQALAEGEIRCSLRCLCHSVSLRRCYQLIFKSSNVGGEWSPFYANEYHCKMHPIHKEQRKLPHAVKVKLLPFPETWWYLSAKGVWPAFPLISAAVIARRRPRNAGMLFVHSEEGHFLI